MMATHEQQREHIRSLRGQALERRHAKRVAKQPEYKGVGDIVYRKLAALKIPACDACIQIRKDMNALGPKGCRENVDLLADKMKTNASNHPAKHVKLLAWANHKVFGVSQYRNMILSSCDECERQ